MKNRRTSKWHSLLILMAAAALAMSSAISAPADQEDEKERALKAAEVLQEMAKIDETKIPQSLLKKAKAVAVIPGTVKGAFLVGGRHGKGLVSQLKDDGTWSAPAYIQLSGASVGLQVGVSSTDFVLVFTGHEGFKALMESKVKLGGDASIAAGPVERTAEASTDVTLDSEIYAYSRSKGAFAGVSLDGAALTMNDSANQAVRKPSLMRGPSRSPHKIKKPSPTSHPGRAGDHRRISPDPF